ncbi:hypothetical protein MWH28_05205 [Natroniella sulfidigena]|uniref:hypothetical protein n=1 Tax=Natroniella sulfidigena TaxID=723921 RepID=UPI00200B1D06|nr:hypothetical protein [Natroniella sulfidigena]MCK8816768.1 hypothetical protein [Natroniella sulfidigena]
MGYNKNKWVDRIRNRTDISAYLTHLTKGKNGNSAVEILVKILEGEKIIGSLDEGYIAGPNRACCFQEAPIYGVCQNTLHEKKTREEVGGEVRYKLVGLSFGKPYVYAKGGRPVIYEKLEEAKEFIDEEELWRVVSFDLSDKDNIIDWTHEREWRVKGDFEFSLKNAYVLLNNRELYQNFINLATNNIIENLGGIIVLNPILS